MTLTPAEVLIWTQVTVTQTQLDAFEPAADAKLNADGGSAITGSSRTQLLSYLVAGYATTASGGATDKQSETIGNYHYTRETSTTGSTSEWFARYEEVLSSLITVTGLLSSSGSPMVERVDKDILKLNREYPWTEGRLI